MESYMSLLKRHGMKLWGGFLLGNLATFIPVFVVIFMFMFVVIFAVSTSGLALAEHAIDNPVALLEMIFSPSLIAIALLLALFGIIVGLFTSTFITAGSIGITAEAVTADRGTVGDFFSFGFRRLFPMFGLMLVLFLLAIPILFVAFFAATSFAAASDVPGEGVGSGLFFLLLTLLLFALYGLMFMHAPVSLIVEQKGVFDSISESFNTFKNNFGQVFLSGIIALAISIAGYLVLTIISSIVGFGSINHLEDRSLISSSLLNIVFFPLTCAIQMFVVSSIVFRYLRIIKQPPVTGGGWPPYGSEPYPDGGSGPSPYGGGERQSHGDGSTPYGSESQPYGDRSAPYGNGSHSSQQPYANGPAPYSEGSQPYADSSAPYGNGQNRHDHPREAHDERDNYVDRSDRNGDY